MRIIFFYDERSLNDATLYYVKLIEESARTIGIPMVYKTEITKVQKKDIVFTITGKYFIKAKIKFPFHKTIFWSQGVGPEEYLMTEKKIIKYTIKKVIEFLSIKTSSLLFLVSDKMQKHYSEKYGYNKLNYIIMPCYNIKYDGTDNIYSVERYKNPSFVYAGTLSSWQCIDKTLEIFQEIQNKIFNASLTLLVKERDKALSLIKKYNLRNINVNYVKLSDLQNELKKYKYGFIIRENNIVNNVATPTKMNSYLASGIIPIYTDAVDSFIDNIRLGDNYTICLSSESSIAEMANKIVDFENKKICKEDLNSCIQLVFEKYYNDSYYINKIKLMLDKKFNKK